MILDKHEFEWPFADLKLILLCFDRHLTMIILVEYASFTKIAKDMTFHLLNTILISKSHSNFPKNTPIVTIN